MPSSPKDINPFDIDWLHQHFGLDRSAVISTKWDFDVLYKIKFNSLEAAERFYRTMEQSQCHPQIWPFSNTVELNKNNQPRILEAANQPFQLNEAKKLSPVPVGFFPSTLKCKQYICLILILLILRC